MKNPSATLYLFSGLPATGKSTLAKALAGRRGAVYLRIDTVEQALRDLCALRVEGEGYRLSYRLALDNLRLGLSVVADCCNPIELTRQEWMDTARQAGARVVCIEVRCSDRAEHRRRAEGRSAEVSRLRLPSWEEIQARSWEPWTTPRVLVDTAGRSIEDSIMDLMESLAE